MLIDWFTVLAQIVNFVVLVALLKRFLWARLVKAVDDRESGIVERLREADEHRRQAESELERARAQTAALEQKAKDILTQAEREAEERRKDLIQRAEEQVQVMKARWREDISRDEAAFLNELRSRTAAGILAVIQRALSDLASADLQQCAVNVFLDKLQSVEPAVLKELARGGLTVLSAIELPEDARRRIRQVLEQRLGPGAVAVEFARAPAMSWGIELRGQGRRIGWSADSYMESLETSLKEALERQEELVPG